MLANVMLLFISWKYVKKKKKKRNIPRGVPFPILADFSLEDPETGFDDQDNPSAQVDWGQDSLLAM